MAAYLALKHKETGETFGGSALVRVDEMLCAHLEVECDAKQWYMGWMDWVGFVLAYKADKSVAEALAPTRENARAGERAIIDWFADTFENVSYYGR